MPYNTRHKSLSLPSLGIHIPVTHAARAAAASSKSSRRPSSSPSSSTPASSTQPPDSVSDAMEAQPRKKQRRTVTIQTPPESVLEQTPPPSPTLASGVDKSDSNTLHKIDVRGINDDIVEASILQLQSTANRPLLIKELATVLSQKLTSVQQSANPCAIISSRLTTYMKRPGWTASAPCPLSKELETVHPRRTYFFLTTCPRQILPDAHISQPFRMLATATPSASLTDDSGSDDVDDRRRQLSPSPEVDLSSPEFDDYEVIAGIPVTPMGSFKFRQTQSKHGRELRRDSPPLETDEREFTQTADILQKRKFSHDDQSTVPEPVERIPVLDFWCRDDLWDGDRMLLPGLLASPAIRPSTTSNMRKDEEAEGWFKLFCEWDRPAESIEIDELDCLLDSC